jgi:hypothetical protein
MFYSNIPIRSSVFTEIILRSKLGSFVSHGGNHFFRSIVSYVNHDNNTVVCVWMGIPAFHDQNNYTVSYKIDKNCSGTYVNPDELEQFRCVIGKYEYTMYLPYNIRRSDQLFTTELR